MWKSITLIEIQKYTNKELTEKFPDYAYNIVNTIGRKRALLLLLHLQKYEKLRNNELVKKLGGISPSSLSLLLKQLCKEGLIHRRVYGEIPPMAVEYSLTKKGNDLIMSLVPFIIWLRKSK